MYVMTGHVPPSREQVLKDVERDRQRVIKMDQLYIEDGRHRKDHPMHGLYTGLYQSSLQSNDHDSSQKAS